MAALKYKYWSETRKELARARERKRYAENRDQILADHKQAVQDPVYRDAVRNSKRKSKYGVSSDSVQARLKKQNGVCAICGHLETRCQNGRIQALAVDHDHQTGKFRGLLCSACNSALGLMQDSPEIMQRAADYLKSNAEV